MNKRYRFIQRSGITALLLLVAAGAALAEPTANPNDPIYRAIERWTVQGLVDRVPVMRPYPREELVALLEDVARSAGPGDAQIAQAALDRMTPREGRSVAVRPFVEGRLYTRDDEVQPKGGIAADIGGQFSQTLSYGAQAGFFAIDRGDEDLLPYGERATDDVLEDNAKVSVAGRDIYTLMQINAQTTFAWDDLWIQTGIYRRSYGPFHTDSPVISSLAPQAANLILQYDRGMFRYTGTLSSHTATRRFRETTDPESSRNVDVNEDGILDFEDRPQQAPGKNLFIHSFGFRPWSWLDVSIFEAVVYGPRFELSYLVPLKFMWHAQGTVAFADNSLIGLAADIRPVPGLRIPLTIYVDDASFNDLAQFNFNTKYKMATSTAVQWAPGGRFAPLLEASYETVFPYMYTHASLDPYTTEPNYNNYLHQDTSIGNGLLPNSDRSRLTASIRPAGWLELEFMGALIRHANASDGNLDQFLNDGGYGDNGREGEFFTDATETDLGNSDDVEWARGELTFNDGFLFMQQDDIEHRYQAGIRGDITAGLGDRAAVHIGLGYTFEYVQQPISYVWTNDGTGNGGGGETVVGDDEVNHYGEIEVRFSY